MKDSTIKGFFSSMTLNIISLNTTIYILFLSIKFGSEKSDFSSLFFTFIFYCGKKYSLNLIFGKPRKYFFYDSEQEQKKKSCLEDNRNLIYEKYNFNF